MVVPECLLDEKEVLEESGETRKRPKPVLKQFGIEGHIQSRNNKKTNWSE